MQGQQFRSRTVDFILLHSDNPVGGSIGPLGVMEDAWTEQESVTIDDIAYKVQGLFQFLEDVALHSGYDSKFDPTVAVPE